MLYKLIQVVFVLFFLQANGFAESHHPEEFLKSVSGSKKEGAEIVQHYCALCHAEKPLINIGAPKAGNVDDWKPRLKQGMQTIFTHTTNGFNAMPARGGCFECTDEQLMLAIVELLPKNKD